MSKSLIIKIVSGVLAVCALGGSVFYFISNRQTGRNAVIYKIETEGEYEVTVGRGGGSIDAYEGMRLEQGDVVATQERSAVYITMDDDKTFKLNVGSSLEIKKATSKRIELELLTGEMYYNIEEKLAEDEKCIFSAGGKTMSVRGTSGLITLEQDSDVSLQQYSGLLEIEDENGGKVRLKAGQLVIFAVANTESGEPPVPWELTADDLSYFAGMELTQENCELDDETVNEINNMVEQYRELQLSNVTLYIGVKCTVPEHDGMVSLAHFTPQDCGVHFKCQEGDHSKMPCGHHTCAVEPADTANHALLLCGHYACDETHESHETAQCGHYSCVIQDSSDGLDHTQLVCGHFACDGLDHSKCVIAPPAASVNSVPESTSPAEPGQPCANGHTPGQAATCLSAQVCSVCTEVLAPATGQHTYVDTVVAPSCAAEGYTEHVCAVCGTSMRDTAVSMLEHKWEWVLDRAATCGEDGLRHQSCSVCLASQAENTPIAATGEHKYSTVVSAPTCTAGGSTTYTCSQCNHQYTADRTEALGHSWAWITDKAATCNETGTRHEECSICHAKQSEGTAIAATGNHNNTSVVTPATCTSGGYTTYTCNNCKTVSRGNETAALGHSWSWVVDKAPGCGTSGTRHEVCSRCSATQSQGSVIEPTDKHSYTSVTTAPTCTAQGSTTRTCTSCGTSYVTDIKAPLEHKWMVVVDKAATCVSPGISHEECEVCEAVQNENTEIPATGIHDYALTAIEADCTREGYTVHTCTNCGDSFNSDEKPALGHNWAWVTDTAATCGKSGIHHETCLRCAENRSMNTKIPPTDDHSYADSVVYPTCTAAGYTSHTCKECGHSFSDNEKAPIEHAWRWIVDIAADCGVEGVKHEQCLMCNSRRNEKTVIPATGEHDCVTEEIQPTCVDGGYTIFACKKCEYIGRGDETAPLGHNWTWITDFDETCGAPGAKHEECTRCGETRSDKTEIPPNGMHVYEETTFKETCTEDGYTLHLCATCFDSYKTDTIEKLGHEITYAYIDEEKHNEYCLRPECEYSIDSAHTLPPCKIAGHCTLCMKDSHELLACGNAACTEHAGITSAHSKDFCGSGTQADPYIIENEQDFEEFATAVTAADASVESAVSGLPDTPALMNVPQGFSDVKAVFKLTADLAFIDARAPIGAFAGTFDGGNHTISVEIEGENSVGLFESNSGTIKNLSIDGTVSGKNNVGMFAGVNTGTISDCNSLGDVRGTESVGGIAGVSNGVIYNCENSAGIYGDTLTDDEICKIGGIAGSNTVEPEVAEDYDGGRIELCTNSGTVGLENNDTAANDFGGIIGYAINIELIECTNAKSGLVRGFHNVEAAMGGIGGRIFESEISECINYGEVLYGSPMGGIIAAGSGVISNCENSGALNGTSSNNICGGICGTAFGNTEETILTITTCTNNAFIAVLDSSMIGGIFGGISDDNFAQVNINDCINQYSITGGSYVGGICGNSVSGVISNCENRGEIYGTLEKAGGICGEAGKGVTISECTNIVGVNGGSYLGGICGYSAGMIVQCENTAAVEGNSTEEVRCEKIGGIAGFNVGTVDGCTCKAYKVFGESAIGGIVGHNSGGRVTACKFEGESESVSASIGDFGMIYGINDNGGTVVECEVIS